MKYNEALEKIEDILNEQDDNTILDYWNKIQDHLCYGDQVYSMSSLDDFVQNYSPIELINIGPNGFNTNSKYFFVDDVYVLTSTDNIYDVVAFLDIAFYIIDWQEDFNNSDIQEVLEEYFNGDENDYMKMVEDLLGD